MLHTDASAFVVLNSLKNALNKIQQIHQKYLLTLIFSNLNATNKICYFKTKAELCIFKNIFIYSFSIHTDENKSLTIVPYQI